VGEAVEVGCRQTRLGHRPAIAITITDHGPGLTPDQQKRIFEPFFTTKTKGTGLGMAIASRIVHSHGGTISASSASGARIEITLPSPHS
jgi:signal transduction histidine kinase